MAPQPSSQVSPALLQALSVDTPPPSQTEQAPTAGQLYFMKSVGIRVSTYQRESALTNSSFTLASKLKWATDALAMSVLAALAMEEDPSFQPAIERTDGRAWLS